MFERGREFLYAVVSVKSELLKQNNCSEKITNNNNGVEKYANNQPYPF